MYVLFFVYKRPFVWDEIACFYHSTEMKFYTNRVCPFAHRAWLALEAKAVPYELIEFDLFDKPAQFTEVYKQSIGNDPESNGKVPIIDDNGTIITESAHIVEYLDRKYPNQGHKLFSENALDVFKGRIFVENISKVIPHFYKAISGGDIDNLYVALRNLENHIEGPFVAGADWGFAEVISYPHICEDRLLLLPEFSWEAAKAPKVEKLVKSLAQIPAFSKTHVGNKFMYENLTVLFRKRGTEAHLRKFE